MEQRIAVMDFCSACYAAGHAEHIKEAEFAFDGYIKDIVNTTQCSKFIGFIEAPENKNIFRFHVAVTKPYKSSRRDRQRPPFVKEMKRYAHSKWGLHYCYNFEAEDAMLITANKLGIDNVIMCSVDKDTRQQYGVFYDYFKKEFITVTPEQAELNYWTQVICGDQVDSIVGLAGFGPKKAEQILADASPSDYPSVVAGVYKREGYTYEYFLEQTRLLRILRSRTEVYTAITREQWEAL